MIAQARTLTGLHTYDATTGPSTENVAVTDADRRRTPRRSTDNEFRFAVSDDKPAKTARTINISTTGLLAVLPDSTGVWRGQRVVLSIEWLDTGHPHLLGRVARVERGADHQTYVGVDFDRPLWEHEPPDGPIR